MCQFLGREIVKMGQQRFWPQKLMLLVSFWAQELTLCLRDTLWLTHLFISTFTSIHACCKDTLWFKSIYETNEGYANMHTYMILYSITSIFTNMFKGTHPSFENI